MGKVSFCLSGASLAVLVFYFWFGPLNILSLGGLLLSEFLCTALGSLISSFLIKKFFQEIRVDVYFTLSRKRKAIVEGTKKK